MKTFIAVVHHDPGSAYGITFPDLPGCFAAADEANGVISAGVEALALWFETESEFVQPRDIEAIRAEVVDDLAQGAYLVSVPYIQRGVSLKIKRVNVTFQSPTLSAVDAEAKTRGMSRSEFLAHAALNEIEGRH